ncbi:MAG: thioredoxin domain-containing protein [archaeon]
MICLLAFIVFGILGIFSATYRKIAKEAFECVFKRITLQKCETGLDKRLKAQLTGKVMAKHAKLGGWLYKRFELLSWIFIILLFASLAYSLFAIFNFVAYGNCNGQQGGFCILDHAEGQSCSYLPSGSNSPGPIQYPTTDDDAFLGEENASITIIVFGCMSCPYTKRAVPIIDELIKKYPDVKIVFRDFPLDNHDNSMLAAQAAECAKLQDKYWPYWRLVFDNRNNLNSTSLKFLAGKAGMDTKTFIQCLDSNATQAEVLHDFDDGIKAEVKGTPTFFINDRILVGPEGVRDFDKLIKEARKENNATS